MSRKMEKNQPTKKILKILGEKPVIPLKFIQENLDPKVNYAMARSLKNLVESGYAELLDSGREDYVRITKKGKSRLNSLKLLGDGALVPQVWDGYFRIIILDLSEEIMSRLFQLMVARLRKKD